MPLGRDHHPQDRRLHRETARGGVGGRQHQPTAGGPAANAKAARRAGQGGQALAEGGDAPRRENHRDRVLTADEDAKYLEAASAVGQGIVDAYHRALDEIRATQRGEEPIEPRDPFLLRDITTILIDCGLRPEECFRLRWENVQDGAVHIPFGKTDDARRTIPLTQRTADILEGRRAAADTEWVFPAPTRSGHVEKSSLKKQHPKACALAKVQEFPLYTFRHTCLTRWAARMDRYTLGYLAGHSDFSTTRRYTHPHVHTVREAIERARNGHDAASPRPPAPSPHWIPRPPTHRKHRPRSQWLGVGTKLGTIAKRRLGTKISNRRIYLKCKRISGRGEWIRTTDLLVPK